MKVDIINLVTMEKTTEDASTLSYEIQAAFHRQFLPHTGPHELEDETLMHLELEGQAFKINIGRVDKRFMIQNYGCFNKGGLYQAILSVTDQMISLNNDPPFGFDPGNYNYEKLMELTNVCESGLIYTIPVIPPITAEDVELCSNLRLYIFKALFGRSQN